MANPQAAAAAAALARRQWDALRVMRRNCQNQHEEQLLKREEIVVPPNKWLRWEFLRRLMFAAAVVGLVALALAILTTILVACAWYVVETQHLEGGAISNDCLMTFVNGPGYFDVLSSRKHSRWFLRLYRERGLEMVDRVDRSLREAEASSSHQRSSTGSTRTGAHDEPSRHQTVPGVSPDAPYIGLHGSPAVYIPGNAGGPEQIFALAGMSARRSSRQFRERFKDISELLFEEGASSSSVDPLDAARGGFAASRVEHRVLASLAHDMGRPYAGVGQEWAELRGGAHADADGAVLTREQRRVQPEQSSQYRVWNNEVYENVGECSSSSSYIKSGRRGGAAEVDEAEDEAGGPDRSTCSASGSTSGSGYVPFTAELDWWSLMYDESLSAISGRVLENQVQFASAAVCTLGFIYGDSAIGAAVRGHWSELGRLDSAQLARAMEDPGMLWPVEEEIEAALTADGKAAAMVGGICVGSLHRRIFEKCRGLVTEEVVVDFRMIARLRVTPTVGFGSKQATRSGTPVTLFGHSMGGTVALNVAFELLSVGGVVAGSAFQGANTGARWESDVVVWTAEEQCPALVSMGWATPVGVMTLATPTLPPLGVDPVLEDAFMRAGVARRLVDVFSITSSLLDTVVAAPSTRPAEPYIRSVSNVRPAHQPADAELSLAEPSVRVTTLLDVIAGEAEFPRGIGLGSVPLKGRRQWMVVSPPAVPAVMVHTDHIACMWCNHLVRYMAEVLLDAVERKRHVWAGMKRHMESGGAVDSPSAYFRSSPPGYPVTCSTVLRGLVPAPADPILRLSHPLPRGMPGGHPGGARPNTWGIEVPLVTAGDFGRMDGVGAPSSVLPDGMHAVLMTPVTMEVPLLGYQWLTTRVISYDGVLEGRDADGVAPGLLVSTGRSVPSRDGVAPPVTVEVLNRFAIQEELGVEVAVGRDGISSKSHLSPRRRRYETVMQSTYRGDSPILRRDMALGEDEIVVDVLEDALKERFGGRVWDVSVVGGLGLAVHSDAVYEVDDEASGPITSIVDGSVERLATLYRVRVHEGAPSGVDGDREMEELLVVAPRLHGVSRPFFRFDPSPDPATPAGALIGWIRDPQDNGVLRDSLSAVFEPGPAGTPAMVELHVGVDVRLTIVHAMRAFAPLAIMFGVLSVCIRPPVELFCAHHWSAGPERSVGDVYGLRGLVCVVTVVVSCGMVWLCGTGVSDDSAFTGTIQFYSGFRFASKETLSHAVASPLLVDGIQLAWPTAVRMLVLTCVVCTGAIIAALVELLYVAVSYVIRLPEGAYGLVFRLVAAQLVGYCSSPAVTGVWTVVALIWMALCQGKCKATRTAAGFRLLLFVAVVVSIVPHVVALVHAVVREQEHYGVHPELYMGQSRVDVTVGVLQRHVVDRMRIADLHVDSFEWHLGLLQHLPIVNNIFNISPAHKLTLLCPWIASRLARLAKWTPLSSLERSALQHRMTTLWACMTGIAAVVSLAFRTHSIHVVLDSGITWASIIATAVASDTM